MRGCRAWPRTASRHRSAIRQARCLAYTVFVVSAVAATMAPVAAQTAPPLRRIAPDKVPDYRAATPADDVAVTLPSREKPLGSCERGAQKAVWLRCLKATSDLTDQRVNETVSLVGQKIESKSPGSGGRQRYWARALEQSQELWRGLRNHECQQLATSESGLSADTYEARLLCLIREDQSRVAGLKSRYGIE